MLDSNTPDLSIYWKGLNCHARCTFGCKDIGILISVSNVIRHLLFMNHKFLVHRDARMCTEHLGIDNYRSFVKQISQEVATENKEMVSALMYEYYQESKTNNLSLTLIISIPTNLQFH